jgi:hypothetical protein
MTLRRRQKVFRKPADVDPPGAPHTVPETVSEVGHRSDVSVEFVSGSTVVAIPDQLLRHNNLEVFRVRGDGLAADGVRHGDYLIVERRPEPDNGDLVVASLQTDSVVVRRFFRHNMDVTLESANTAVSTSSVTSADVEVLGIVAGILRKDGTIAQDQR